MVKTGLCSVQFRVVPTGEPVTCYKLTDKGVADMNDDTAEWEQVKKAMKAEET